MKLTEIDIPQNKTLVVITGGTIEALYSPDNGTPYYVPVPKTAEESAIPAALKKMGLDADCDYFFSSMKDSKEVQATELDGILHQITKGDYARCIIVHGTDTMPLHARYMQRRFEEYGGEAGMDSKRIIFTGAMKPLRDEAGNWHEESKVDGWNNLRRAVIDANNAALTPGVYVEMGEGPWDPRTVKKTVATSGEGKAAKVTMSGFGPDDPERHREIIF